MPKNNCSLNTPINLARNFATIIKNDVIFVYILYFTIKLINIEFTRLGDINY